MRTPLWKGSMDFVMMTHWLKNLWITAALDGRNQSDCASHKIDENQTNPANMLRS
jgi:hypothetical protein